MEKWMIKKGIEQGYIYFNDEKIPYKNVIIGNVAVFLYDAKEKFVSDKDNLVDSIYQKYIDMSEENKQKCERYLSAHITTYSNMLMETLRNAIGLKENDDSQDGQLPPT